jgi:hypothetical protein
MTLPLKPAFFSFFISAPTALWYADTALGFFGGEGFAADFFLGEDDEVAALTAEAASPLR